VGTFLITLHVIVVVLVIGPMVLAPFFAGRAIARRKADSTRAAANALLAFGIGSIVAAGLGALAVAASRRYNFGTPWVTISMTVYVLVLVLAVGYAAPASRKAARMIQDLARTKPPGAATVGAEPPKPPPSPPAPPPAGAPSADDADASTAAMEADLRAKQRIDQIVGRITGSGLLILLGVILLVVLMVVKPFGG
jgi:hypothetical protein